MTPSHWITFFGFVAAVAAGFLSVANAAPPPGAFGALPAIQEAQISPDGETVALLENINGVAMSNLYSLRGGDPVSVRIGEVQARDLLWVGDDYVLLLVSQTRKIHLGSNPRKYVFWRFVSISRDGKSVKYLFSRSASMDYVLDAGQILHGLPDDPDSVLIAQWDPDANQSGASTIYVDRPSEGGFSVFRVNLRTGKERQVNKGDPDTDDWVVDSKGEAVLRIDYERAKNERIIYKISDGKNAQPVAAFPETFGAGRAFKAHAVSEQVDKAFITAYIGGDTLGLHALNLQTGKVEKTLFQDAAYDIDQVAHDYDRASLTGVKYVKNFPTTTYLDERYARAYSAASQALRTPDLEITSVSRDGGKAIIRVDHSQKPAAFFLYDREARSVSALGSSYPDLEGALEIDREIYDYTSPDGLRIPGYLTTPSGAARKKQPLIVLPHGGPAGRDDLRFDWWAAFYAAHGYAVYQPNFRGSEGYGYKFRAAGYGEWGRKMQDDITQGVRNLIADGVADPERICIVGASYGGYAALAGATLTPDLYACAVSVNGVSNLLSMLGAEARESDYGLAYWQRRIGRRVGDSADLAEVSPALRANSVKAPILIIYSKDDTIVPPSQSRGMKSALDAAGKPYEYLELDGEDHWLSTGAMRTKMLERSLDFIDRRLGRK